MVKPVSIMRRYRLSVKSGLQIRHETESFVGFEGFETAAFGINVQPNNNN